MDDPILIYEMNPKALTWKELFGYSDPFTNVFVHGVVSKLIDWALNIKN